MNLIILGPQGSGKGTQAKLLAEKFHLAHISSGDLLRAEAASGSEKGVLIGKVQAAGELVPFETITSLLEPAIEKASNGFILDGTPRDVRQAEYLDYFLNEKNITIDKVILLEIPRDESLKRLQKRAQIEGRADDTLDAINERLNIYEKETLPVIEKYRAKGNLIIIDGTPDIHTIFQDIV
ncbi:MAG TPA: adenylate kinase, partial [Spirochaetia bacterium]|nr:adenylate kinase [Spirochaetia bacterium]